MAVLASQIITSARQALNDLDSANYRFPDNELLGWINDGQRAAVVLKPEVSIGEEDFVPVAGSRQALPAGGLVLVDVLRHAATGSAVVLIEHELLDRFYAGWRNSSKTAAPKNFCYDVRNKKQFDLYPPSVGDAAATLVIVYIKDPVDIPAVGSPIALDDVYRGALTDYVLYRAFGKDSESPANSQKSQWHFGAFQQGLGIVQEAS